MTFLLQLQPNLPGSRELGTGAFFTQKKGGAALRKGARCFFGFFPEGWLLKYQASTKRTQFFRRVL